MDRLQEKMRDRWVAICSILGFNTERAQEVFRYIVLKHEEPHRAYHTLKHIRDVMREFDLARHQCENPHAIEIAIWFHDIIYDVGEKYNEENSAATASRALKDLGAKNEFIRIVMRLIMVTKHGKITPVTKDEMIMVDSDLAGLGLSKEEFEVNKNNVELEYKTVFSDDEIRKGQKDFFQEILKRENIYYTDWFRGRYEDQARSNLKSILNPA